MMVPAVAYGPKIKKNLHVYLPELELEKVLRTNKKVIIKLVHGGKEYNTLLQKVEYDPVTDRPIHVDLFALEEKTQVTLTIPIRLTGTPQGVTEGGGRLYQPLRSLQVKCFPKDIPAEIVLDVSELTIGDTIDVSSIDVEGIEPLRASFRTIAVIRPPKGGLAELLGLEEEEETEEGEEEAEGAEKEERTDSDEGGEAEASSKSKDES